MKTLLGGLLLMFAGTLLSTTLLAQIPQSPGVHTLEASPTRERTAPVVPAVDPSSRQVESVRTFNPYLVKMQWHEGHWLIMAENEVLKDFGSRSEEARQALMLIRDLRLNQVTTIGWPRPVMEYWLSNNEAPQGRAWGMPALTLETGALQVDQLEGQWYVREPGRLLLCFGPHQEQAERAKSILQQYRFNQVVLIGSPTPSMMVFLKQTLPGSTLTTHRPQPLPVPVRPQWSQPTIPGQVTRGSKGPMSSAQVAAHVPTPIIPPLHGGPGSWVEAMPIQRTSYQPQSAQDPNGRVLTHVQTETIPLDWRQARVVRDRGEWKLMCNNYQVANFAGNEQEARQALAAMQFYRLTEHRRLGQGTTGPSYFLSAGQAPRGTMIGLRGESFQPEELTIRAQGTHHVLAQGERVILDCGANVENARLMLQIVQQQRFDTLCRIGSNEAGSMLLLVRGH